VSLVEHPTLTLARELMEVLSRHDVDALIERADPEIEWFSRFAHLGDEGVFRGHDATRHYMETLEEAFDEIYGVIDDGVAVGDVAVLVGRIHYRGRGSGLEGDEPTGWVLTFKDGRLVRFYAFRDPEQVLAGLDGSPAR
jgi:ketosteroid isomerase-like protein